MVLPSLITFFLSIGAGLFAYRWFGYPEMTIFASLCVIGSAIVQILWMQYKNDPK